MTTRLGEEGAAGGIAGRQERAAPYDGGRPPACACTPGRQHRRLSSGPSPFSAHTMLVAITREVSPSLGDCQLTHVARTPIDVVRADAQHRAYQRVLASLGCRVLTLQAEPSMPDAVFVEDVAIVLDEVAVMTRPGAESRRGEGASVAELLSRYRPLRHIEAPGTIDGGDVLRVGRTIFVGQSGRSNAVGIAQLQTVVAEFGYRVQPVPIRGCLHLKSAVTAVRDD